MTEWSRLLIGAAIGASIAFAISFFGGIGQQRVVMQAQHRVPLEDPRVTEEELQTYIDIYVDMQSDRSLKIDDAVASREMTVADFRALERRVQAQRRLIQRVREAMLEQAKQNATSLAERGVR